MYRVWLNIVDSDGTQLEINIYRGRDRAHAQRVYRGALGALSATVNRIGWEEAL